MLKKLPLLFLSLFLASAVSVAVAADGNPGKTTPAQHSAVPVSVPLKTNTPLERLFIPEIKKRAAAVAAQHKAAPAVTPMSTGLSTVTPNWAGFGAAPFYPARLEPSCVSDPYNCGVAAALAADYNQDGKSDVAVLQYDGTLNILLNNGSGGFAAPVAYSNPNGSSTYIQQAFAVDVNNDGYPDVVALDSNNSTILVWLNLKNGAFSSPIATNLTFNYGSIGGLAVGDVNGDGNVDIVALASNIVSTTSSNVTIQTLLGAGNGNFAAATTALTQTIAIPAQVQLAGNLGVALGNLYGDGNLDIAVEFLEYLSQTQGQIVVSVARGNGNGSFGTLNVDNPISAAFTYTGFPGILLNSAGVQILDLNGDKNNDLAVDVSAIGSPSALIVALGDGSGNFTSTVQTAGAGGGSQIVYADVNGDGIPDLVETGGQLNVWIGKGDGTFSIPVNGNTYIEDGGSAQSLALADFNGDGNIDIAQLGGDYKQISLFLGNGKGAFAGAPALSSTTDSTPSPYYLDLGAVADVQGKGYSSALFIDSSGASPDVVTAVSDGKGNLTWVTGLAASAVPSLGFIQPVQADFNGDGMQDLLVAGTDGSLAVALSNGDGTFKTPVPLALPALDCEVNYAAAADVNGDGIPDVVVAYPGDSNCGGSGATPSGYFVALGKGDGTFGTPAFTAYGNELYSVTIADMNMDGKPDLLLDDAPFIAGGAFAVDLLPGNGDGSFTTGTTVKSDYLISQVIAGDYNQDGKPDLILLSEGEQTDGDYDTTAGVLLVPGNGDGTFGATTQIGTGNFFLNGSLTDVNNDGVPDLVIALYNTIGQPNTYYGLSTLLGEGGGAFSSPVNTLESMDSVMPLPGNFYNDNAPDFIVATAYGAGLYLGQGGNTIALSDSGAAITFGQSETLTATIAASMPNRPAPTGTVSFYDGTTLLESVSLSGGTASLSTASLAVGTHSITAVYSGDGNFNPNTSSAVAIAVSSLTPAFTLAAAPGTLSLSRGQNGVATLTLAANATFSGSVALSCSGAPANATCAINPISVTLTPGGTVSASLVFGTTTAQSANQLPATPWSKPAGMLSFAAVLCAFAGRRNRKRLLCLIPLLLLAVSGIALSGCGNNSTPTATAGSYTLTVTATPSGGSGTAQTATVSVTVQQ